MDPTVEPDAIQGVLEYAYAIVVVVVPVALAGLAVYVSRKWLGIKLDDSSRAALQSALEKAAVYGVDKARGATKNITIDIKNEAIDKAVDYTLKAVPGALTNFGITPDRLKELVEARIGELVMSEDNSLVDSTKESSS